MKKYIVTTLLAVALITPSYSYAASYLPSNQIDIVVSILRIFNLDQTKIDKITNILRQPTMEETKKPVGLQEQKAEPEQKKSKNSRFPASA